MTCDARNELAGRTKTQKMVSICAQKNNKAVQAAGDVMKLSKQIRTHKNKGSCQVRSYHCKNVHNASFDTNNQFVKSCAAHEQQQKKRSGLGQQA